MYTWSWSTASRLVAPALWRRNAVLYTKKRGSDEFRGLRNYSGWLMCASADR